MQSLPDPMTALGAELTPDLCQRAVDARDPRFDGIFFVAITTTRVYCRPVCPARVTYRDRRRFYPSAAAAEQAGFRPCLRCRPELAPGRALCDAVSRLAGAAAQRIAAGALNGRPVAQLARELCVSERHLRRALERELGVSPVELAQTHRLLFAKRLLSDTNLSITRIAYASGFQSLRRFNALFRERYRMAPNALRQSRRAPPRTAHGDPEAEWLHLTLSYRAPLAWGALLASLGEEAIPGVEIASGRRYGRTVRLDGVGGAVFAESAHPASSKRRTGPRGPTDTHVNIVLSASLLPALMPLLPKLRQLFDLDADPTVIDAHLAQGGLAAHVRHTPGVRVPGTIDGFDVALRSLLGGEDQAEKRLLAQRVVEALGEPIDTGIPTLTLLMPDAGRVADAGSARLVALGVDPRRATSLVAVARMVAEGALRLDPGEDPAPTAGALREGAGVDDATVGAIVMRALHWPDALPSGDTRLQRAAAARNEAALLQRAEAWRPWRAYAATRLLADAQAR